MSTHQGTDVMTAQPVVEGQEPTLKRTASLKKVTQKFAKALSINGIKSRLSSAGSGVDPADIQMLEQIINETQQQQQLDKGGKKKIIRISLSRGGSRAGSRAASPRIGTQVETTEQAPAEEAAPEAATETVDKVEAVPKAQEAAAPKPSGWRWGKAIFAIAVGVVASGVVVAVHHGQRGAPMRSARK